MKSTNLKKIFNHILLNIPEENVLKTSGSYSKEFQSIIFYNPEDNCMLSVSDFFWCFGGSWDNNKEQVLLRIKYLIDNGKTPDYPYDKTIFVDKYNLPSQNLQPYNI